MQSTITAVTFGLVVVGLLGRPVFAEKAVKHVLPAPGVPWQTATAQQPWNAHRQIQRASQLPAASIARLTAPYGRVPTVRPGKLIAANASAGNGLVQVGDQPQDFGKMFFGDRKDDEILWIADCQQETPLPEAVEQSQRFAAQSNPELRDQPLVVTSARKKAKDNGPPSCICFKVCKKGGSNCTSCTCDPPQCGSCD